VGGRVVAGRYPEPADSLLLRNEGGRLVVAHKWEKLGLVSGAVFSDFDLDGDPDLILAYRGRYSTKPPRQAWKASARRARNAADRCNTIKAQYNLKQFPDVDLSQLDGNKWVTLTDSDIRKMF
jgi:hypothetical protein